MSDKATSPNIVTGEPDIDKAVENAEKFVEPALYDHCPKCGSKLGTADRLDGVCSKCKHVWPIKIEHAPPQVDLSSFDAWEIRGAVMEAERLHDLARSHERHAESLVRKAVTDAGQEFDKHWGIHVDAGSKRVVLRREVKEP